MARLFPSAGHLVIEHAGHRTWSTNGRPVNLLPAADWLTPSLSITFPDFIKRNAYMYLMEPYGCMSFSTLLPGEWFPGAPSPRNLPETVLGTVPSGVNFIDVRLTLSRTKAPTNYLYRPVVNLVPTQQTLAPGGSCLCEYTGLWSRAFEIVLSGTNVVLRRRQSVVATVSTPSWNSGNNNDAGIGGRREGWTHGGGSDSELGYPAAVLQISPQNEVNSINKRRGEAQACSLVDNTDFSSIWTGSAVIRPGYITP